MGKSTISMVIFQSLCKRLPEATCQLLTNETINDEMNEIIQFESAHAQVWADWKVAHL